MEDRWDIFLAELTEYYPTLQKLKTALVKHLKTMELGRMKNSVDVEEYEVVDVKLIIKKVKSIPTLEEE